MSWPSLHSLVNHFPIVLTVVGALAVLLSAMVQRRASWMYALTSLTLAGLTIYPAWLTGGATARAVHNAWYIERGAIHTHSSAADITLWIVAVTAVLALLALITMVRTRDAASPAKAFRILVGIGALASLCAVCYTGYLGGKIVVESPILASPTPPVITAPVPGTNPTASPTANPTTVPSANAPAVPSVQAVPPVAQPVVPDTLHAPTNLVNPTTPAPRSQTPPHTP